MIDTVNAGHLADYFASLPPETRVAFGTVGRKRYEYGSIGGAVDFPTPDGRIIVLTENLVEPIIHRTKFKAVGNRLWLNIPSSGPLLSISHPEAIPTVHVGVGDRLCANLFIASVSPPVRLNHSSPMIEGAIGVWRTLSFATPVVNIFVDDEARLAGVVLHTQPLTIASDYNQARAA